MDSWTKSQNPQFLRDSGSFHARSASKNLNFYVLKRPGVDELLEYLRENDDKFEVVVFTAGLREYASLVLDKLDGNREYSLQPENGVLVQAFVDDVGGDCELSKKRDISFNHENWSHYYERYIIFIALLLVRMIFNGEF
ncbi:hypothetical protein G4B88_004607 [Cannabis sativa]|uniref:Mitochondrial import inner membrane translocase subunit TIM50 n=1 Tax=Cannabis sativa TaxID=3483 RepID=A0A7J6G7D6_CANSA|nr:hypothetical protein G4B88_004607 [Cannabis sativa]